MQSDQRFTAKTFKKNVEARLEHSRESFEYLVDAYTWWQHADNEREMNKAYPRLNRQWLREKIMAIFSSDPRAIARIVTRLAGSKEVGPRRKAWEFVKRVGTWELYHADRVLKPEQLKTLPEKFPGTREVGAEEFRNVVDDMAAILKSRPQVDKTQSIDYRGEYHRLLEENAALRQRLKDLQLEMAWIKKQVKVKPLR